MVSIAKMGCYCFRSGCATKLIALNGVGLGVGGAAAACFAAARSLRLRFATRLDQATCRDHSSPLANARARDTGSSEMISACSSRAILVNCARCLAVNGSAGLALRMRNKSSLPNEVSVLWCMAHIARRDSTGLSSRIKTTKANDSGLSASFIQ